MHACSVYIQSSKKTTHFVCAHLVNKAHLILILKIFWSSRLLTTVISEPVSWFSFSEKNSLEFGLFVFWVRSFQLNASFSSLNHLNDLLTNYQTGFVNWMSQFIEQMKNDQWNCHQENLVNNNLFITHIFCRRLDWKSGTTTFMMLLCLFKSLTAPVPIHFHCIKKRAAGTFFWNSPFSVPQ